MIYRYFTFTIFVIFIITTIFVSCDNPNSKKNSVIQLTLSKDVAENLAKLPIKCLQKEFPNKLNQTLSDTKDLDSPAALHPAFYGCFDWHSSVHGHWMLVKLLKEFPNLSLGDSIINILKQNLTAGNLTTEIAYFNRKSEKSFERTYGWAWLLKLQAELDTWDHPEARKMADNLQPLSDLLVDRYLEFLHKLNYPVRSGEHPNTAFGLALALDYAISAKKETLIHLINKRSRDFFFSDKNCPLSWEPGGFDFLSPCLQEADLMSRILPPDEFKSWIDGFLPELKSPAFTLIQAKVSDRSDGKLVHLDGVNFCRAWSLFRIANVIPEYSHLIDIGNQHIEASLTNIADGGYEGEHWLASFAIYALTDNRPKN